MEIDGVRVPTEPGVYFGMPEEVYHAIPALSSSGTKQLRVSTMDFWARSWLNPRREENADAEESEAKLMGRAYHARILEGREAFYSRYLQALDPLDYPDAYKTADDIKTRLRFHKENGADVKLSGNKEELAASLKRVEPDAQIWDDMVDEYEKDHVGKELIAPDVLAKVEFGAAMIERKPDLARVFQDGMPEVVVIYSCPDTGILCKLKIDYLKPRELVDLKSFANLQQRPVDEAIGRELANRRMAFQAAWYMDGARYIAPLIRAGKVFGEVSKDFLGKLRADHDRDFLFVFLQKGVAPVARGKRFSSKLAIFQIAKAKNDSAKQLFCECQASYPEGAPWVDRVPTSDFNDDDLPVYAAD